MTLLLIDDEVLSKLNRSMTDLRQTLSGAGGMARNDGKAAGDGALQDQLVKFAEDWRRTRNHMLEEIDTFQSMVQQVVQGFEKMDAQLAAVISQPEQAQQGSAAKQYADAHGIAGPRG